MGQEQSQGLASQRALSALLAASPLGSGLFITLCQGDKRGMGDLRHLKMSMVYFALTNEASFLNENRRKHR